MLTGRRINSPVNSVPESPKSSDCENDLVVDKTRDDDLLSNYGGSEQKANGAKDNSDSELSILNFDTSFGSSSPEKRQRGSEVFKRQNWKEPTSKRSRLEIETSTLEDVYTFKE